MFDWVRWTASKGLQGHCFLCLAFLLACCWARLKVCRFGLTLDAWQGAAGAEITEAAVVAATCEGNLRASRSRRLTGFLPAGNKWPLWLLYPFWAGQGHINFCLYLYLTVLLFRTFFVCVWFEIHWPLALDLYSPKSFRSIQLPKTRKDQIIVVFDQYITIYQDSESCTNLNRS